MEGRRCTDSHKQGRRCARVTNTGKKTYRVTYAGADGVPGDTCREEDVSVHLDEVGGVSWPHALSVIQN